MHNWPRCDSSRTNLCNSKRQPRLSRSVGFRTPRACHYEPRRDPDALFDVPIANPALDRQSRRFESTHDLSARQAVGGDVSPLLSGCPGCYTTLNGRLLTTKLNARLPSKELVGRLSGNDGSRKTPTRSARETSSASDRTCIFAITLWRCALMVRSVPPSAPAICLFVLPRMTSPKTC